MQFRVYYEDGTTYAGDPFNAPAWGVLCIVEPDADCGRHIVQGGKFYVWRDDYGRWYEADDVGLYDYLARPGARRVLFGSYVSNEIFNAVYQRAYNDPDFLPKTALAFGEKGKR
jgi:hypothetical protein